MRFAVWFQSFTFCLLCMVLGGLLYSFEEAQAEPRSKVGKKSTSLSDFELYKYQYCGADRDCVLALNGCCDCANGGQMVVVNRERYEDFKDEFYCHETKCGDEVPVEHCGVNTVVTCVNHRCQLVTPIEFQLKAGTIQRN